MGALAWDRTVVEILFYVLVPLLVVPPLVRYCLLPLLILVIKGVHLPRQMARLHAQGTGALSPDALDPVLALVRKKLKSFTAMTINPLDDLKDVIAAVVADSGSGRKDALRPDATGPIRLDCTVLQLIYVGYRIFDDLHQDYGRTWWFRRAGKIPIGWYRQVNILGRSLNRVLSLPHIRFLRNHRFLGRAVRLLLIPLVGVPDLIISVFLGSTIGLVHEALVRYAYGTALLRAGYYSICVYGMDDPEIHTRMASLATEEIHGEAERIRALLGGQGDPDHDGLRSPRYQEAVQAYQTMLGQFRLQPDPVFSGRQGQKNSLQRSIQETGQWMGNIYSGVFSNPRNDRENIPQMVETISRVWVPSRENLWDTLRCQDLVLAGYCASILAMDRFLQQPLLKKTLGGQRVHVLVSAATLVNRFRTAPGIRQVLQVQQQTCRSWRFSRLGQLAVKAVALKQPGGLVIFLAGAGLKQALEDHLRQQVYYALGRITLYVWDQNDRDTGKKRPLPRI